MFGPGLAMPLVPFLFAAAVVGAVVLRRRVPSHELSGPVVRARRRGTVVAGVALVCALVIAGVGLSLPPTSLARSQLLAVAPLAAASLYAAVLLVGELSWPRPRHRLRSARLAVRTVRQDAPRGLVVASIAAGVLLLATCVAGTALADDTGRGISWAGEVASSSGGPFPGVFYAGPIAVAAVLTTALTWAVLLRVPHRPGVAGADAATDGALRRAVAHRALRVSTASLLGTCAALLVIGGQAAGSLGGSWSEGATVHVFGPGAGWDAAAHVVRAVGLVLLPAALAVLLVPARGVRR